MHVNCIAHLVHNCAMLVRAHFKNIDKIETSIKAAAIKNKDREKDFYDAGLPFPSDPLLTVWVTWLKAAYITVINFQLFASFSTIGQVQAS